MKAAALVGLLRPFTLLAPAVGVVAGAVIARSVTHVAWEPWRLAAALVSALLATAASNAWNQAFDVEVDRVNKPERPIPSGRASVRQAILLGHALALSGLAAGFVTGAWFFACVAAGVFATWIYSAPPLRTKRHRWGALVTIAVPRGALVPVAGWSVVATPVQAEPWVLGLIGGLFVFGAAVTKDFADVAGDRAHGCRTQPVVVGARRAAWFTAPFLVLPFLLYPAGAWLGLLTPGVGAMAAVGGGLALLGLLTAFLLTRDPSGLERRSGNHPAWALMYLLLLGSHVGLAAVYASVL